MDQVEPVGGVVIERLSRRDDQPVQAVIAVARAADRRDIAAAIVGEAGRPLRGQPVEAVILESDDDVDSASPCRMGLADSNLLNRTPSTSSLPLRDYMIETSMRLIILLFFKLSKQKLKELSEKIQNTLTEISVSSEICSFSIREIISFIIIQ